MAGAVELKLTELGVTLSSPTAPIANYVAFVQSGNLVYVSGQLCFDAAGRLVATGKLAVDFGVEQGEAAARACAVNLLTHLKSAVGDLDRVTRVVRLGGFINAGHDFSDGARIMNGASNLMVAAFGDKGRHARTTVGVAALPLNAGIEVEGLFEVG